MKETIYTVRSHRNSHVLVTMTQDVWLIYVPPKIRDVPTSVSASKDKAKSLQMQRPLMKQPATLLALAGLTTSSLLTSACAPAISTAPDLASDNWSFTFLMKHISVVFIWIWVLAYLTFLTCITLLKLPRKINTAASKVKCMNII